MNRGKFFKILVMLVAVAAVIVVVWYLTADKKEKVEYVTAMVERGRLVQTVNETGTVKAVEDIDLNFLNSGRVDKILVKVGDKVEKEQVLAELDYSNLRIKEREARANLNKIINGATKTEIAVKQASVNQTYAAYLSAQDELEKVENTAAENISQQQKTLDDLESDSLDDITVYEQAIESARTSLDNTKRTYARSISNEESDVLTVIESELTDANTALDKINTVITDDDAKDVLSIKNTAYLSSTKSSRNQAIILLSDANNSLAVAKSDKTELNINKTIDNAKAVLNKTFESLNFCFDALGYTITSSDFTQAELDSFKSDINTELTTISASISAAQTAEQNLSDARLAYDTNVSNGEEALTKAQVALDNAIINAGNALNSAQISGDQQITIAQAKVDNGKEAWEVAKARLAAIKAPARSEDIILSQAAVDTIKKQIEDSIIKASIDGTITAVNYEIGEQTFAGEPAISMLGKNNFEVEIDISEADIAKVDIGNMAEITLDAFGDEVKFSGKVYFTEPAETVIQDVIYYRVKVEFVGEKQTALNIKSGMTANAVIVTAQKNNVLIIPNRAVIRKNGPSAGSGQANKYARVLVGGQISEAPIKTGLRGDEGMVEVLSGVKEGDEVITFIKK